MTDRLENEEIERMLYANLVPDSHQIKVAMLLVRALGISDFPADDIVNSALDKLVLRSDIQSFGQIHNWRNSEIKRNSSYTT